MHNSACGRAGHQHSMVMGRGALNPRERKAQPLLPQAHNCWELKSGRSSVAFPL